jgi:hypothetical protein
MRAATAQTTPIKMLFLVPLSGPSESLPDDGDDGEFELKIESDTLTKFCPFHPPENGMLYSPLLSAMKRNGVAVFTAVKAIGVSIPPDTEGTAVNVVPSKRNTFMVLSTLAVLCQVEEIHVSNGFLVKMPYIILHSCAWLNFLPYK